MHYYKRHLGDYARDTGHLTALEHGVYNLLLDWYYINECPIPEDKAIRISRGNPEETKTVLSEFFSLSERGWVNKRAEVDIADYKVRAEKNRDTGKLGGRPKKTQTVSETNPETTLATSHKPLAITEKEQEQSPATADVPVPAKPKRAKSAELTLAEFADKCAEAGEQVIPADHAVWAYAEKVGLPADYVALAWGGFKAKHTAPGNPKRQASWRQTFLNSVKGNWTGYWAISQTGEYYLTTAGKQAEREARA